MVTALFTPLVHLASKLHKCTAPPASRGRFSASLKPNVIITGVYVLFLALPVQAVDICRCVERPTLEDSVRRAFAVFTGTVIEMERELRPDRYRVRLQVHESWKGVDNSEVTVLTEPTDLYGTLKEGVSCGYVFQEGERYLIFSYRDKKARGPAQVSRCGRTAKLHESGDDIRALGEPKWRFTSDDPYAQSDPALPPIRPIINHTIRKMILD